MLFKYEKNTKKVSPFSETLLKNHGIFERQDIEKWVEISPEILGEILLILTTEYDKFDKTAERLDLLALDKLGKLVVIELKRDDSGKTAELQAIKYAAYCSTQTLEGIVSLYQQYQSKKGNIIDLEKAKSEILAFIDNDEFESIDDKPRIILVAKEFRPEVTASVLWLRKFNIDIKCVKITPYEMSKESIILESSVLIPLPEAEDFIVRSEKKENEEHTLSISQQEYMKFFNDLINMIRDSIPLDLQASLPKSYYIIPTGISNVHFEWGFHGRPRSSFGVELHFEKGNKTFNRDGIRNLAKMKSEIEKQTGEPVIIQEEWGSVWARLYIERREGKMTEELKDWAVNKMIIFYNLLKPEIEKLK